MESDGKDKEMIVALTADQQAELRERLRNLRDTMPPREVWDRIRAQGEAEGLLEGPSVSRRTIFTTIVGVAAAAALAAVMLPALLGPQTESYPVVPTSEPSNSIELSPLQTLMVQSRQLENDLASLPEAPSVMLAGTVATISELEDRIAAIDYQLNDADVRMTPGDRELFWRERVRLMRSLLQLRYAQAQRAAF